MEQYKNTLLVLEKPYNMVYNINITEEKYE